MCDYREVNYQDHSTAGCVIQGTLFIAANIAAVALRYFPTYAPVAPLLHVMSISFLLDLPSELRTKMLERSLDWQRLRTIEACGIVGAAALTLGLALAGANVYACSVVHDSSRLRVRPVRHRAVAADVRHSAPSRVARLRQAHQRQFRERVESSRRRSSRSRLRDARHLRPRARHGYACSASDRIRLMSARSCARAHSRAVKPTGDSAGLRVVAWDGDPDRHHRVALADRIVGTCRRPLDERRSARAVGHGAGRCSRWSRRHTVCLAHQEPRKCLYADVWRLAGMAAGLLIALPFGLPAYIGSLIIVHGVAFGLVTFWLAQSGGVDLKGIVSAIVPAAAATVVSAIAAEVTRALLLRAMPAIPLMATYGIAFGATYL